MAPSSSPKKISVEGSGRDRLNGTYVHVPKRGRPAVNEKRTPSYQRTGDESMWLYWLDGNWKIGTELGSSKSFARSKDGPDNAGDPCDSGRVWKVFDAGEKEYKRQSEMRVSVLGTRPARDTKATTSLDEEPNTAPTTSPQKAAPPRAPPAAPTVQEKRKAAENDVPAFFKRPKFADGGAYTSPSMSPSASPALGPKLSDVELAAKFEEKLSNALAGVRDREEQKLKLELFKGKVMAQSNWNGLTHDKLLPIIDKVQQSFDTKAGILAAERKGADDELGTPSPKMKKVSSAAMSPPLQPLPPAAVQA